MPMQEIVTQFEKNRYFINIMFNKQILIIRTFWVILHIVTCLMIILGNAHIMGWW